MKLRKRLIAASILAACGSDAVEPGEPTLELTTQHIETAALDTTLAVVARLGADTTSRPHFRVKSEQRWLHDVPVLDAQRLQQSLLVTSGAGSVVVEVSAFGATAELQVDVRPGAPVIFSLSAPAVIGSADTLTVRGYALHQIEPAVIRFAGVPARVLERDSANVRIVFPDLTRAQECVAPDSLSFGDAVSRTSLTRERFTVYSDLLLAVGESRLITPNQASCLRLPAGTRHTLAFFDTRRLDIARAGFYETADETTFQLTVTPLTAGSADQRPLTIRTLTATSASHVHNYARVMYAPPERTTAWAVGDTFRLHPGWILPEVDVRVAHIFDDYFVMAVPAAMPADSMAVAVDLWRPLYNQFVTVAEPLLRTTLAEGRPRSTAHASQFFVMMYNDCRGGAAISEWDNDAVYSWVTMSGFCQPASPNFAGNNGWILTHELAHAWSFEYLHRTYGVNALGSTWGTEGVAQLFAQEAERLRLGVGLMGNIDYRSMSPSVAVTAYGSSIMHNGEYTIGYASSAAFLRDLIIRRMRAGETYEAALAAVTRGALTGWYGVTSQSSRTGLVDAMKKVFPAFEPAEAILLWTLSTAVDDLTNNPELQIPGFLHAGLLNSAWRKTVITAASPPHTVQRRSGTSSYLELSNGETRGNYRITSSSSYMAYMIARTE